MGALAEGDAPRQRSSDTHLDWRSRRALREVLQYDDLETLASKLRARADRTEFRFVHPALLEKLSADRRVIVGGQRGYAGHGGDLVPVGLMDAYIRAADLPGLERDYALQHASQQDANLWLRLVASAVPWRGHLAPRLFIAADLAEYNDARSRQAAKQLLAELRAVAAGRETK